MAYNKRQHLEQNIEALRAAFEIGKGHLSVQTFEALRGYSGFGGLKCVCQPDSLALWKSDRELFPLVEELKGVLRENSRDEAQYKLFYDSLRSSVLTAFYTPKEVADAVVGTLHRSGVDIRSLLEPSAGTGVFVESFRELYPDSETVCYEKDTLTGRVLGALHPESKVFIDGFQRMDSEYNGYFDAVVSNIPFGNTKVFDAEFAVSKDTVKQQSMNALHSYFFLKGVEALREGGVLAFITSQGVMNSPSNALVREWLVRNCDLLSAVRLPNNTFSESAGTFVGSDLIVLQRHSDKEALSETEQRFLTVREIAGGVEVNNYFTDLSHIVQTKGYVDNNLYGRKEMIFLHEGGTEAIADTISRILSKDIEQHFNRELYQSGASRIELKTAEPIAVEQKAEQPKQQKQNVQLDLFSASVSQGDLFAQAPEVQSGSAVAAGPNTTTLTTEELLRRRAEQRAAEMAERPFTGDVLPFYKEGTMVALDGKIGTISKLALSPRFKPLELSSVQHYRAERYMALRNCYNELFAKEAEMRQADEGLRKRLNSLYDSYVGAFGDLCSKENVKFVLSDALGRDVLSLERYRDGKREKADIFFRPVSFFADELTHADSATEALSASLNRYGGVNLGYMESLLEKPTDDIIEELRGKIYFNPLMNDWEIADRFIAGNVVRKAEEVRAYLEEYPSDQRAKESLSVLEASFPRRITFEELDFNFGERWIPTEYYDRYLSDLYSTTVTTSYSSSIDEFSVDCRMRNANIYDKYCVRGERERYCDFVSMSPTRYVSGEVTYTFTYKYLTADES